MPFSITLIKVTFLVSTNILNSYKVESIWPPAYKVNLSQEETFVIFESFGSEDDIYSDEDEMIKPRDLEHANLEKHEDKYFLLHKLSKRKNEKLKSRFVKTEQRYRKIREAILQYEDPEPWIAGYVNEKGKTYENKNVYYSNKLAKEVLEADLREKREEILSIQNMTGNLKDENYDYKSFQSEFNEEIREATFSNETANYTDVKEEESVKDAVESLVDFKKTPRNCTEEETKGIGFAAAECFWLEIKNSNNKTATQKWNISKRIFKVCLIWFCVYLIIAIPCWCQKGWCCCCFRCKACKPRERIDEAKRFFMINPPGVYHTDEDGQILYEPTIYERDAQKKLEQVLMKL